MTETSHNGQILDLALGEKTVLWIADVNRYILAENWSADIILQLNRNVELESIAKAIALEDELEEDEAMELVQTIQNIWLENCKSLQADVQDLQLVIPGEPDIYSKKKYAINGFVFGVHYETEYAEWINHPKFAHLEIEQLKNADHTFLIGDSAGNLSIWVDGQLEGHWKHEDNHFLSGRFSMKVIEKMYQKEEKEWMGVFHAAGISDDKQSLLFFGDSGNGKSTLSALAMAAGFDVLSDDFLPVDSQSGLVHRFPAALSIKKNAYDLVKSIFPELMNGYEYENPAFGKIYRYLPSRSLNAVAVPCKAIIEVKYDSDTDFLLERIPPEDAFAKLVPDSWINASAENAVNFINWFRNKKHYRLRYSDNEKMIEALKQLLDD